MLVRKRPMCRPVRQYATVLAQGAIGLGAFGLAYGYFSDGCEENRLHLGRSLPGHDIAGVFLLCGTVAFAIGAVLNFSATFRAWLMKRRRKLARLVAEMQDVCGYGALDCEALRKVLMKQHNKFIPEELFRSIISTLPSTTPGKVYLRDFLAVEPRFWDVTVEHNNIAARAADKMRKIFSFARRSSGSAKSNTRELLMYEPDLFEETASGEARDDTGDSGDSSPPNSTRSSAKGSRRRVSRQHRGLRPLVPAKVVPPPKLPAPPSATS
eukprot:Hpha_TRINITY_DN9722_c0_g2::TRINITY_DN9722_c0_g2_i1::g.10370::m.10370